MTKIIRNVNFWFITLYVFALPQIILAQSLEGRISDAITRMIQILNILLIGALAWAGFTLARGENTAVTRIIYCIVALIVVNSARLIIDYFYYA